MSAFGRIVKQLLEDLGVSQRAFADKVQISQANLNKILNGSHEAPPPPLGKQLEMWFDELCTKEEQEPLLRMLASAAHVPDDDARAALEALLIAHFDQVEVKPKRQAVIPLHAAEADLAAVPSTRSDAGL